MKPRHELARIHHQNTDGDQHRRQAHAKGNDQQQAEADPLHRYSAQEHDQSRGARHDAAADAEGHELAQGYLALVMIVLVPMAVMVRVMMWVAQRMMRMTVINMTRQRVFAQ